MSRKIHLIGVGTPGTYQLCTMVHSTAPLTLLGSFYPTTGLFLLDQVTGNLLPAENMPVTIKPGFLKQGRHDKFGDSSVLHCTVAGAMVPKEVSSTLGLSLPSVPNTNNTGYYVYNDPNLTKVRLYAIFGTSSALYTARKYHLYNKDILYCDDVYGTVGTFTAKYVNGYMTFTWVYDNIRYNQKIVVTVKGNWLHFKRNTGDLSPNLTQGSYVSEILTKQTGYVARSSSSTSTGLTLNPWSAPKDLSSISEELVLASIGEGDSAVIADLISLSSLPRGNAEWLSCYQAVESRKHIQFETMEQIRDSFHWKQLLPPLKSLINWASPKGWAEVFLWFQYGIRPTISNAQEIVHAFEKNRRYSFMEIAKRFATKSSTYGTQYDDSQELRGNKVTYKCNARVTVHPNLQPQNMVDAIFLTLKSFNVEMSATNIWELLPYSFVVDWFANTNRFCNWLDYTSYPTYYTVDQINISHKRVVDLPANTYYPGASGSLQLRSYARELHYSFPAEPFDLRSRDPSSHWLEGAALLVAKNL